MSEPSLMPDDPDVIKEHIKLRQEAVRILLHELGLLSQRLREKLGPADWVRWMAEQNQSLMEPPGGQE